MAAARSAWPLAASLALHALLLVLLPVMASQSRPASLTLELLPAPAAAASGAAPASPPPGARAAHAAKLPPPAPTPTARAPAPPPRRPSVAQQVPAATPPRHSPPSAEAGSSVPRPTPEPASSGSAHASVSAGAAAPAGASDHGSASGDSTAGANWRAAYLRNPPPVYPERSRERGEEGRVVLRVVVGADGRVLSLTIVSSSGFARLDRAARDAVLGWRFEPARRAGRAVEDTVDVPVRFNQRDD